MKLALVGKNISHSRSPEIYKKLLGDKLTSYTLLDYSEPSSIPKASDLLVDFDGISITSPYKKHFLPEVTLVDCPPEILGINCMRLLRGKVEATNTDFLAIKEILLSFNKKLEAREIAILGDGVMAQVTELALLELHYPYKIYSRKKTENFNQLSFKNAFVINTCSRDYIFTGKIHEKVIFWDYNYNFSPHQNSLPLVCDEYIDGISLLETQAKYAARFWQGSNSLKSL